MKISEQDQLDLVNRSAITDLHHRFCRAIDRCDVDLLKSLFHEDAVIDHPPLDGPAPEFCEKLIEAVGQFGPMLHYLSNLLIDFEGEVAYAESYFTAWYRAEDRTGDQPVFPGHLPGGDEHVFMGGRYFNELTRRDGVWRIAYHTAIVEWEDWRRADERGPMVAHGRAQAARNRSDLIYKRR